MVRGAAHEAAGLTHPNAVMDVVGGAVPRLLSESLKLVVFLGFLCSLSGTLCLLFVGALPATVALGRRLFHRRAEQLKTLALKHEICANQAVSEGASMIATVKAFSREGRHEAEFDAASRQLLAPRRRASRSGRAGRWSRGSCSRRPSARACGTRSRSSARPR